MTTKPGIEEILNKLTECNCDCQVKPCFIHGDPEAITQSLHAIRQLLIENLGKEKPLDRKQYAYFVSRGKEVRDNYFDKFNQDRGYNTSRSEDIDVINKLCGGSK